MAICEFCKQEMTAVVSCGTRLELILTDNATGAAKTAVPVRYGDERRYGPMLPEKNEHCHDCGCPVGGLHHPGCDMEECPFCRGQLITCACNDGGTFADKVLATA